MHGIASFINKRKKEKKMAILVIIRGNSGSGKTTLAKQLQDTLGGDQLLISQDVVRRHLLDVRDTPENPAIPLIEYLVHYGLTHCSVVILEGILAKEKYGSMLTRIQKEASQTLMYYYDLSIEETRCRHQQKEGITFNVNQLAEWFLPNDLFGGSHEKIITSQQSLAETVQLILTDLQELSSPIK